MITKKLIGAVFVAAVAMTGASEAAVVTLGSTTAVGTNTNFTYNATLGPDEGVRAGDRLVIFDFAGYVPGSIFTGSPNLTGATELTSTGLITGSQTDDASLLNLVFTYNGPDFRNTGGPFASLDFTGFGAVSTFSSTTLDGFTTITTKNNPPPTENTMLDTLGTTQVPAPGIPGSAVPEPSSWLMLLSGFGIVGFAARRRRTVLAATS